MGNHIEENQIISAHPFHDSSFWLNLPLVRPVKCDHSTGSLNPLGEARRQ
jgi:hypothetical protein